MDKKSQGPAPEAVREQAAQYAIRPDPGERVARLEGEINHMATSTEVSELKRHVDIGFKDVDSRIKDVDTRVTSLNEKMDAQIAASGRSEKMMRWALGLMVSSLGLIVSLLAVVLASMIIAG